APTRRHFIGLSSGLLVAATLPGCALTKEYQTGAQLTSTADLPEQFTVPLPVPRTAKPTDRDGADHYEITQRNAEVEILPGKKTPILGYDGEIGRASCRERVWSAVGDGARRKKKTKTVSHRRTKQSR